MLRPGSAGANTAADHSAVLDAALAQLPENERAHVLVRTDTGGGVKQFLHHITDLGLEYSVGFYGMPPIVEALGKVPRQAWRAAIDGDGQPREGAQVAELTRYLPDTLIGWPKGMRAIARRERPHPGAQLRLTDHEGWRITCFATNTRGWRLADLEVRHRQTRPRRRGPDPWPEGHRAAEPALPRLRPEPDLAGDRRPGRRPAHLDPDPGLAPAPGPTLGTQTTATATPVRRRTDHPQRPTPTTPTTARLALEPPHRHRLGSTAPNLTTRPSSRRARTSENRRTQRRRTPLPSSPGQRSAVPQRLTRTASERSRLVGKQGRFTIGSVNRPCWLSQ